MIKFTMTSVARRSESSPCSKPTKKLMEVSEPKEETIQQQFQIDPHLIRMVIGPNRKHLDFVESNTQAQIELPERITNFLALKGTRSAVDGAIELLKRLVQKCMKMSKQDYMLIPSSIAGLLIGRDGERIREVASRTSTKCSFQSDHSNRLLNVLCISGTESARQQARQLIDEQIEILLSQRTMDKIVMPQTAVSAIIGRNGQIIQNINRLSGAKCNIEETAQQATVYIIGDGRARQRARFLIDRCIEEMIQRDNLTGPEEAHLIFSRPFPTHGVIRVTSVDGVDGYVMDIASERNVRMPPSTYNCISIFLNSNRMLFNLKTQQNLMGQLLGRVSDFVSKVAMKEYSIVKLELSLGKQTFNSASGAPPAQFSLPDACHRANGKQLGEFFTNSRYIDKTSDSVIEDIKQRLVQDGFQEQQRSAYQNQRSLDIYWKYNDTKERVITKLHVNGDNEVELVHVSLKKFKPIVVTFLHPMLLTDFRIRVVVRADVTGEDVPDEIQNLIASTALNFKDTNDGRAAQVKVEYPLLFNIRHKCVRVKEKTRYFKDDFKASIHRIYQQNIPFSGTLPEYHQLLGLPSGGIDNEPQDIFSNEITFKSTRLNKMLRQYCTEFEAMDSATDRMTGVTQSVITDADDTTSTAYSEDQHTSRAAHERKLKEDLAYELGSLVSFGDSMVRGLPWQFGYFSKPMPNQEEQEEL